MPSDENELGGLNSDQWRDLEECASRLEKTLQAGTTSVDVRRFLPPAEAPHRRAVLIELIKTEIEIRYARGKQCFLEEYLQLPGAGRPGETARQPRVRGISRSLRLWRRPRGGRVSCPLPALTFKALEIPRTADCTRADFETTFRIVLEER